MNNIAQQTQRSGRRAALWGQAFAGLSFLFALMAVPYLDRLTNTLLVLSTFLFCIVCRFAGRYLMGDPGQSRFMFWLCLTGASVFALILAQNLLVFAICWCAISLSLHQLLLFYNERPGALLAARKKFLISRMGDACLLGALVVTHRHFGTWDFQSIFAATESLRSAGAELVPSSINWIGLLLAMAAVLKSAQFPFHSWLPDTMETPTPVSALMHAGIINAGGILVIRLSPLVSLSEPAMVLLCLVGAFTAVFASTVMLTQASVKRYLAFSTVGQMGFMMLECGLGAFHLALLHLVAHSLYKAQAFLSSGSAVVTEKRAKQPALRPLVIVAGLVCAGGISVVISAMLGLSSLHQPVLLGIFSLALAQLLWTFWGVADQFWLVPAGLIAGAIFSVSYFGLDRAFGHMVTPFERSPGWLDVAILMLFVVVALVQTQSERLSHTRLFQQIYVHARNGFYFNTLANQITTALWPGMNTSKDN